MSTYWELLKHPLWQRKRLEMLNRAQFACEACYNDEATLHVHHRQYIKGRKPWEYDDSNFLVLCERCHEDVTKTSDRIKSLLAKVEPDFLSDIEHLIDLATSGGTAGLRAWQLSALCAGYAVGSGMEGDTPWAEMQLQASPVLFHRGLLAGVVAMDTHHDGQAQRDMALFHDGVRAATTAWPFFTRTIGMMVALDEVPAEKRTGPEFLMKEARENLPPREGESSE
jgi:5-methylcytosine-specific restriction endonuclease McrA